MSDVKPVAGRPADSSQKDRLSWVDTGRGVAILLVPLYHATNWLLGSGLDIEYWREINNVLSSLRMPLFFTLAGLFAPKWLTASWRDLLRTKTALFVWVFLLWETVGSVVILVGQTARGQGVGLGDALRGLLISPVLPRFELWFIWALALFFIFAKATRRVDYRIQLALAGAMSSVALGIWLNQNTGWTGSAKYYFFFLAGMYLRPMIIRFGSAAGRHVLVASFVVWAAVSLSLSLLGVRGVYPLYFVNCLLGVVGGIALSRGLSRVGFLRTIGQKTLPIYLAHTPIIILLAFVVSLDSVLAVVATIAPVAPVALAAVAICLSLLLHRVCSHTRMRYLYEPPLDTFDRLLARSRRS